MFNPKTTQKIAAVIICILVVAMLAGSILPVLM